MPKKRDIVDFRSLISPVYTETSYDCYSQCCRGAGFVCHQAAASSRLQPQLPADEAWYIEPTLGINSNSAGG